MNKNKFKHLYFICDFVNELIKNLQLIDFIFSLFLSL